MKFVWSCVTLILLFMFVFLLFSIKTHFKIKKRIEPFTTLTSLSAYNIKLKTIQSTSICDNPHAHIRDKLKVILNSNNYNKLRDTMEDIRIQESSSEPITNCAKLKQLFCNSNYEKIKHFINLGLHDGNNVWNIEDLAQGNANTATPSTLNSNIICENLNHLLENFHKIENGILACEPPPSNSRSYRTFDLNCTDQLDCPINKKLNSNLVDVTTRFKLDGDPTNDACVRDERCDDHNNFTWSPPCVSWTCGGSAPIQDGELKDNIDASCSNIQRDCTNICTPAPITLAEGENVRLRVFCNNEVGFSAYLDKKDKGTGHIGFSAFRTCFQRWKMTFLADEMTFYIQFQDHIVQVHSWYGSRTCDEGDHHGHYLNLDKDKGSCSGRIGELHCDKYRLKPNLDDEADRLFYIGDAINDTISKEYVQVDTAYNYKIRSHNNKYIAFSKYDGSISWYKDHYWLYLTDDKDNASWIQIESNV